VVRPAPGARVIVQCTDTDNCLATERADHLTVRGVTTSMLAPLAGMPRQAGVALDRGSDDVTFQDIDAGHIWISSNNASVLGGDYGPTVDEVSKVSETIGPNLLIDGATFHDHMEHQSHMECIALYGAQGVTIRRSRFDTCTLFGIFSTPEPSQHFRDVLIENNVFTNSGGTHMSTHLKIGSHGGSCTNFLIRNNTFIDEDVISDCGINEGTATNIRWIGNIFSEWSAGADCNTGGHVFDYNVIERGRGCGRHDHVVGRNGAGFVDRSTLDLRLGAGSPAIDRGSPDDFPATDIDGNPRPFGRAPDAGADEFGATGGVAPGQGLRRGGSSRLRLRVGRRARMRRGRVVVRAACSEPCRLAATLAAPRGTARRLGLSRRARVVGRGRARLAAGRRGRVAVKLTRPGRAALRSRGRVRLVLGARARAAAGDVRSVRRRILVVR
jgi:Right handed beta helix region